MMKTLLTLYSVIFLIISCKFKNSEITNHSEVQFLKNNIENKTQKKITVCNDRLREMVVSCGSGCALNLKEKKIELREENTYKITFTQEIYINEQKSDESLIEYYFLCNGKIIERVYDNEINNYLDENYSTPTQKLSFEKYGESLCECIN